tara:strand:+ start:1354 stop:3417 length:2064 start_codon:yes stop_codon:yes gene_type:complete
MAYNNQKGPQHTGDIQYEGDPNETQIDFDDDSIKLKTGGTYRLEINNNHVSASGPVSASSFHGDGSGLTGLPSAAITTYNSSSNNRIITSVNSTTVQGESNLTFDGSKLSATGQISASLGISGSVIQGGDGKLSLNNTTSGNPQIKATGGNLYIRNDEVDKAVRIRLGDDAGDTKFEVRNNSDSQVFRVESTGKVYADNQLTASLIRTNELTASSHVSASAFFGASLSASVFVSASQVYGKFFGDGSSLTGLPSAAITAYGETGATRIITSVDTTSVQGESNLTFDGTELIVSGVLTVDGGAGVGSRVYFNVPEDVNAFRVRKSGGTNAIRFDNDDNKLFFTPDTRIGSDTIAPDHALSVTGDISASVNISASAFYGDGSNLNGISAGPITNYNSAGATRIITSVDTSTVQGESNLTFDSSVLSVTGDVSAQRITSSVGIHVTGANPSIAIGDRAGSGPQDGMLAIRPSDTNNKILALMQGTDASGGRIALGVSGSGAITVGGAHFGGLINVTGSGTETLISAKSDLHGSLLEVKGSGAVGILNLDPKTALDVHHNPTILANDTGGGEVVKFGAGTTIQGKTYYLHSNGNWDEVDISVPASGGLGMLATALGTSPSVDGMLIRGFFDYNTQLVGGFTTGATVYLSGSGQLTTIRPSGSGQSVRVVGTCTTTGNVIYFNPSPDYLVVV